MMNALECFACNVLKCGQNDLLILDKIESELVYNCVDKRDINLATIEQETKDLQQIVYYVYELVLECLAYEVAQITQNTEILSLINSALQKGVYFNYSASRFEDEEINSIVDFELTLNENSNNIVEHYKKVVQL